MIPNLDIKTTEQIQGVTKNENHYFTCTILFMTLMTKKHHIYFDPCSSEL